MNIIEKFSKKILFSKNVKLKLVIIKFLFKNIDKRIIVIKIITFLFGFKRNLSYIYLRKNSLKSLLKLKIFLLS